LRSQSPAWGYEKKYRSGYFTPLFSYFALHQHIYSFNRYNDEFMGILHRSSVLSIDVIRALSCSVNLQPEALFAEVQDPDATVTFDDVVGYNANYENHPVNISAGGIIITLQGSLECGLFDDFGLGQGGWFLGLSGGGSTAFCEIVFSYPVSRFSMRVASDMYAEGGIFAFDESGEELNCHLFPWVTETNNNAYSVRGFNSSTNNIKRIVLKESYLVADLLTFIVCPGGYNLIKGICQGMSENESCWNSDLIFYLNSELRDCSFALWSQHQLH
jgi:hypothetical protein